MIHAAAELSRKPGRLLACLAISMAVQCLFVGINIAFAQAAHVEAPVSAWFCLDHRKDHRDRAGQP
ncbi:MAG: hypothetical protein IPN48_05395 [Sphingomonadales bacterium]|nr:hypothetical protein [Sphingomonadales bacterium]